MTKEKIFDFNIYCRLQEMDNHAESILKYFCEYETRFVKLIAFYRKCHLKLITRLIYNYIFNSSCISGEYKQYIFDLIIGVSYAELYRREFCKW